MNDWVPFQIQYYPSAPWYMKGFAIIGTYVQFLALIAICTGIVRLVWNI